jgi:hypothetical protein
MNGSRSKIPCKNLVRQCCAEGFNSSVKGLNQTYNFVLKEFNTVAAHTHTLSNPLSRLHSNKVAAKGRPSPQIAVYVMLVLIISLLIGSKSITRRNWQHMWQLASVVQGVTQWPLYWILPVALGSNYWYDIRTLCMWCWSKAWRRKATEKFLSFSKVIDTNRYCPRQ